METVNQRFAEAIIPDTPNVDALMINGARQAVAQALQGKEVGEWNRQELIDALKEQGGADKAQQSFVVIADTYLNDKQRYEQAHGQALAYATGFRVGLGEAKDSKEKALQYLDSLERARSLTEEPDESEFQQESMGLIAGIKKGLSVQ